MFSVCLFSSAHPFVMASALAVWSMTSAKKPSGKMVSGWNPGAVLVGLNIRDCDERRSYRTSSGAAASDSVRSSLDGNARSPKNCRTTPERHTCAWRGYQYGRLARGPGKLDPAGSLQLSAWRWRGGVGEGREFEGQPY